MFSSRWYNRFIMITLLNKPCETAMKNLADHSIDAIINDPPFGITQCKWDDALDMTNIWPEYLRILKPNGVILLFASQPFTSRLICSNEKLFRYVWYWEKEQGTNFLNTKRQPLRFIEEVCVFAPTSNYTYKPKMILLENPRTLALPRSSSDIQGSFASQETTDKTYITYTESFPKNLIKFGRDRENLIPTQKPLALLEYMIETYTNKGDTVLDNTMGSGTCGVACKRLERDFIGMEIDPDHFTIAKKRIDKIPSNDDGFFTTA